MGKKIFILTFVLALSAGGYWIYDNPKTLADSKVEAAVQWVISEKELDTSYMQAQIESALAGSSLDTSVSITDVKTGKSYHFGDTSAFKAASITKLLTAAMYLHESEQGKVTLSSTAKSQLEQLIVNSDNVVWRSLNTKLTEEGLGNYASQIGINSYDPVQNTITGDDISLLLYKLYSKELLNVENTARLLSYMKQAGYDEYIPAAVTDATVYHKAGWLADRFNDAAIIDDGEHAYVLIIFSKSYGGSYSTSTGTELFHSITKAANQTMLREV